MRSSTMLRVVILGTAVSVARAGPLPPPAVLIDSAVAFVRSDRDQRNPAAAFDGSNWLVVWEDKRGDDEAIWGARFSAAGVLLDSANICIADDTEERTQPKVAFNGTCFLVVWQDGRNRSYDIYGARVTPAGALLDPDGFMISRSDQSDIYPTVASSGSDFLVAWEDHRNSGNDEDIYAARVIGSGVVLDTVNIAVSTARARQENVVVTGYSGGYLLAWTDFRNEATTGEDVYVARVSSAGSVLDPDGIAVSCLSQTQHCPQSASDGTNCLVVWEDYRNASGDIYGARVSNAGVVLDPSGLPIHASSTFWQGDPSVAYTGSQFLVVWEDDSVTGGGNCDILASRVTTTGQVLDPSGLVVTSAPANEYYPAIVRGGSNLLVAWQDYRNGEDPDIYATRVSLDGARLDTADVMLSRIMYAYEQFTPAAAFDGANFLTVWSDLRTCQQQVFGARITPGGTLLDPGGFYIGTNPFTTIPVPALAFGTSNYLVAINGGLNNFVVEAARVTPAGGVLDTNWLYTAISGRDGTPPAVASDGSNWLIVAAFKDFGNQYNVQGVRIAPCGTRLDSTPFRIAYGPRDMCYPAATFGLQNYLAVWQDFRSSLTYDIYGARISTDGAVLDSGIAISTAATSQYAPSVAFDGTNWLVTWQDNRNGGERELFGTRVSQSGTVLDPSGIRIGSCPDNYEDAAALAFDGTNYFAVWQWRNCGNGDLWGARISPAGVVIDTFPVCTAPEYQATPAVAVGAGGTKFVSYSGYVSTLHGYPAEKMRIWAGIYPFYGISETMNDESGTTKVGPTIVRGVLQMATGEERKANGVLLDVAGRTALDLKPGPNDVSHLTSGVYFVRMVDGDERSVNPKVVVTQ